MVSVSSIEHSGLGRYGDLPNPWADILTLANAWCVTKNGGKLILNVPDDSYGQDRIDFNSHRVYGSVRYPWLTMGWHQLETGLEASKLLFSDKGCVHEYGKFE